MRTPKLIAHRGYALRYPENTLAAFEAAFAAGARLVECDVQLSRDGVPFLLHDRTLERMCGVARALHELCADEARELRASEPHRFEDQFAAEPLASLDDFAQAVARHASAHAFVEVKRIAVEAAGSEAVLDAVLPALAPIEGRCTLISFDVGVLQAARKRGNQPLGPVLIDWAQREDEQLRELHPEVVFCDVGKLPRRGPLRALDAPLAVYEVDDPQIALALARRGVELVETFSIAQMRAALEPA